MVKHKQSRNCFHNLLRDFRNIDCFSETINFNFDGGKAFYKTYVGASMTLLLTICVTTFGALRFDTMMRFKNANV